MSGFVKVGTKDCEQLLGTHRTRARVKENIVKKSDYWCVDGVHAGKSMSDLPITYLLWFIGSPVMRRVRWSSCKIALLEIRRRLLAGTEEIEADLISGLERKTLKERLAIKLRRKVYCQRSNSSIRQP